MLTNSLLRGVPFVLLSLLAPDKGAPAGGGAAAPVEATAPAWAPSAESPALVGDSLEDKNKSALGIISDLFKKLGAALVDFTKVSDDLKQAQSQFETATQGWEKEKTDHKATQDLLKGEKDEHAKTKGTLEKSSANITRLEKLCDLKGIDKDQIVPTATGPVAGGKQALADEYADLKKKEDKGEVPRGTASKFYRKNKKALEGTE